MRVIPAARAKIAQEALLAALYSLLEAASDRAASAASISDMDLVADLCADSAKAAAVIALLGRRSQPVRA
ncbi:hypothetical protein [Phenylobacterium sp. 58.2.17]|uniref:hypothetical protein n=1 Tax=Phenylobacterium sp. 58.2.17 TaxID=2969306 RepID=UPI00226516CF|nr:hypothetical protein [Phenylobacterium sp. 58.2.17]MCX7584890.1 hypothetical protein [Phenylobacterium sp. 58.2.17]